MLGISRSSCNSFTVRKQSNRNIENELLLIKIKAIFAENRSRYGSPRITAALKAQGILTGKNRIARIMKENHIVVKTRHKRHNKKTVIKQSSTDLVERRFNPVIKNSIWASDITYIRTKEGWKYFYVVMDLFSRMIVGWKVNNFQSESIILHTVEKLFTLEIRI
jgi:putative transposase